MSLLEQLMRQRRITLAREREQRPPPRQPPRRDGDGDGEGAGDNGGEGDEAGGAASRGRAGWVGGSDDEGDVQLALLHERYGAPAPLCAVGGYLPRYI